MKCFIEIVTINDNVYRGIEKDLTDKEIEDVGKFIIDILLKNNAQINIERYTNEGKNKETVFCRINAIESIKLVTK